MKNTFYIFALLFSIALQAQPKPVKVVGITIDGQFLEFVTGGSTGIDSTFVNTKIGEVAVSTDYVPVISDRDLNSADFYRTLVYAGNDTLNLTIPVNLGNGNEFIQGQTTGTGSIKFIAADGVSYTNFKSRTDPYSTITIRRNSLNNWAALNTFNLVAYTELQVNPTPTFVEAGTYFTSTSTANPQPIIPTTTSIEAGELLLLSVGIEEEGVVFTTPTGWNLLSTHTSSNGVNAITSAHYWKRATAGENGSVTVNSNGTGVTLTTGVIARFGVVLNTGNPIEDLKTVTFDVDSTSFAQQPMTSTTENALAVTIVFANDNRTPQTFPAAWTEVFAQDTVLGTDQGLALYTLEMPSPTTTIADTYTFDTGMGVNVVSFILKSN